jgi:hypothetical protein
MLLSIDFLVDVGGVNNYDYTTQLELNSGDTQTIYFQLTDLSIDKAENGYNPPGRRYMPALTSTLSVEFLSVECGKSVIRAGTQPFSQDGSIWAVPILGTDPLQGTIVMKVKLVEPTRTLNFVNGKGNLIRFR